jgi:hypothetical protein
MWQRPTYAAKRNENKMKHKVGIRISIATGMCLAIGLFFWLGVSSLAFQKEKKSKMTTHASGTFDVKMTPQASDEKSPTALGRFSLEKQFHGDLEGTSKGEMLAVSTAVPGSAGYVAIEQITGTLKGQTGTFALQHNGIMTRGAPQLSVTVVPDSGTGELTGISGRLDIKIAEGQHFYEFDYTLAP